MGIFISGFGNERLPKLRAIVLHSIGSITVCEAIFPEEWLFTGDISFWHILLVTEILRESFSFSRNFYFVTFFESIIG